MTANEQLDLSRYHRACASRNGSATAGPAEISQRRVCDHHRYMELLKVDLNAIFTQRVTQVDDSSALT